MGDPCRRYGRRSGLTVIVLLIGLTAVACTSGQPARHPLHTAEPKTIIIRNHSGFNIDEVRLSAQGRSDDSAIQFGAISPVLNGVDQAVVRGSSPPPLPSYLYLMWEEAPSVNVTVGVSVERVLAQASGHPAEALVFELRPKNKVSVYLERRSD